MHSSWPSTHEHSTMRALAGRVDQARRGCSLYCCCAGKCVMKDKARILATILQKHTYTAQTSRNGDLYCSKLPSPWLQLTRIYFIRTYNLPAGRRARCPIVLIVDPNLSASAAPLHVVHWSEIDHHGVSTLEPKSWARFGAETVVVVAACELWCVWLTVHGTRYRPAARVRQWF